MRQEPLTPAIFPLGGEREKNLEELSIGHYFELHVGSGGAIAALQFLFHGGIVVCVVPG
jgi:hypothetical protein